MRDFSTASLRLVLAAAAAAALLAPAAPARAGGIMLPGFGPVSTSRAGAFVATADDPSAIAVNPAGLAKQEGTVLLIGSTFIDYALSYQRSGVYDDESELPDGLPWAGQPYDLVEDESKPKIGIGPFQAVPILAVSTDLGLGIRGLRFGAGVFAPNAYPARSLAADYVLDDPGTKPPASRYDVVEEDATVVQPSIAVAYRVMDKLDLGARFTWGIGDIKATTYTWGILNFEEWTHKDAIFKISAKDNFIPIYAFGALFRPTSSIELGAHWTSQIDINARGTGVTETHFEITPGQMAMTVPVPDAKARCDTGGTAAELKACVDLGLPMTASLGGRYILRDAGGGERGDVELDAQWEHHSATSDYKVVVDGQVDPGGISIKDTFIRHGLQDVLSVRLGGSYRIPVAGAPLTVRAGAAYDTAAARDDWERLDLDGAARTTLALGAGYKIGRFSIDLGGGAVLEGTREVGSGCNPPDGDTGCDGRVTAVADRTQPDPVQPLSVPGGQKQSPFNDGTYKSHYVVFMLGLTAAF